MFNKMMFFKFIAHIGAKNGKILTGLVYTRAVFL